MNVSSAGSLPPSLPFPPAHSMHASVCWNLRGLGLFPEGMSGGQETTAFPRACTWFFPRQRYPSKMLEFCFGVVFFFYKNIMFVNQIHEIGNPETEWIHLASRSTKRCKPRALCVCCISHWHLICLLCVISGWLRLWVLTEAHWKGHLRLC